MTPKAIIPPSMRTGTTTRTRDRAHICHECKTAWPCGNQRQFGPDYFHYPATKPTIIRRFIWRPIQSLRHALLRRGLLLANLLPREDYQGRVCWDFRERWDAE